MSPFHPSRDFIRERLTAAAEEIFTEVEKNIVRYEEELQAQRRMMEENCRKQEIKPIKLSRIGVEQQEQSSDVQQPRVSIEEEASSVQQSWNQGRRSSGDQEEPEPARVKEEEEEPEPARIKEEEEEPEPARIKEEEEEPEPQLMKEENEEPKCPRTKEEHMEPELPLIEEPDSQRIKAEQETEHQPELLPPRRDQKDLHSCEEDQLSHQQFSLTLQKDLQKHHVSIKEEASVIQQLWKQEPERREEEQREPEPVWIKNEEEEADFSLLKHQPQKAELLLSRPEGEQFVHQQSTTLMEISTLQEGGSSEERRPEQLSSHNSPVVESKDQEGSSSTGSETQSHPETKKRSCRCHFCGRSFESKFNLEQHYKTHTGENLFTCKIYGKGFSEINNVNIHSRTKRPFSCQICGKGFYRMDALIFHKKVHIDKKPISCETCGKCFQYNSHLNTHRRTHTGERPFSCPICGKSYIVNSKSNSHMRLKH